jgi:hypothetical protein
MYFLSYCYGNLWIKTMAKDKEEEDDLLAKEIRSWGKFRYALRQQNATLFDKMLKECQEGAGFAIAMNAKGEPFTTESSFMVLILLQQQRMINNLIQKLSNMKNPVK